jgi:hypothetical protein
MASENTVPPPVVLQVRPVDLSRHDLSGQVHALRPRLSWTAANAFAAPDASGSTRAGTCRSSPRCTAAPPERVR